MTDYSREQVTAALLQLVANGGNVKQTAEDLIDDEFQVPEATLRGWKSDVHREEYERLERTHGDKLEAEAISLIRGNMQRAAEIERDLLERCAATRDARVVPQALKAVSDSRSKSVDKLMTLTGRAPKEPEEDVMAALHALKEAGLLRDRSGVLDGENGAEPASTPAPTSEP